MLDLHAPALELGHRSLATTEEPQHADLVVKAQPAAPPGHLVPLRRREPRIRCRPLVLRCPRITAHRGIQRVREQVRQRGLGEIPYVPAGYVLRDRQAGNLCQHRARVDPLSHAVHSEPHKGIAIPDRPRNRRRPPVPRQCRWMHIQHPKPRKLQDRARQTPVTPEHKQQIRLVPGQHAGDSPGTAGQQQVHANWKIRDDCLDVFQNVRLTRLRRAHGTSYHIGHRYIAPSSERIFQEPELSRAIRGDHNTQPCPHKLEHNLPYMQLQVDQTIASVLACDHR